MGECVHGRLGREVESCDWHEEVKPCSLGAELPTVPGEGMNARALACLWIEAFIGRERFSNGKLASGKVERVCAARCLEASFLYAGRNDAARERRHLAGTHDETAALCRWHHLLGTFGETPSWTECGVCDNCVRMRERPPGAEGRLTA